MDAKLTRRRRRASVLLIVGAASVAAVMIVLVFGFVSMERSRDRIDASAEAIRGHTRAAFAVFEALTRAESGQRAYGALGREEFRTQYVESAAATARALERLREGVRRDPLLEGAAGPVQRAVEARLAHCARVVAERDAGRANASLRLLLGERSTATSQAARAAIFDFLSVIETRNVELAHAQLERRAVSDRLAIALAALAFVAFVVTGWAVLLERRAWTESQAVMAEANAALESAHAEARASDAAKTRFLAVASHDLRQPLHALSLYISALKRRVEGEEAQKIIANMERATLGMIHMFSSLLDLARIQSGVLSAQVETIAAQELFQRIAAEFANGRVTVAPTAALVRTDPRALEGILRNLVSNALKHGGGAARLEARERADGVLLCVIDQGQGIPEDKREEIFEEFTRLPGAKAEGLGLGLTIVKRTAERLGLPVVLESEEGNGALFGVLAPQAEAHSAPAKSEIAVPSLAGVKAICVDDEPMPLAAVAQILRDAGAEVQTAQSEAELNALIDGGSKPDVIVMDLRLNGELRGVDAVTESRARLEPKPGVVLVTGDTAPDTLAMLQASGFIWMVKPAKPKQLVGVVAITATMSKRGKLIDDSPFDDADAIPDR